MSEESAVAPPDFDLLLAEIDDEVRRRRESGEIPPELEGELRRTFARYAPPSSGHGDLATLIEGVRASSFVDLDASVDSSRRGVAEAKKVVRKAIAFQMRHVASQVNDLGVSVANALQMLADRLTELEDESVALAGIRSDLPVVDGSWMPATAVVDAVSGAGGRVLHLGAAEGSVVQLAIERGLDAYGVEGDPRRSGGMDASIRTADPVAHCVTIADEALGAVVLTVEEADVVEHHRLAREAVRATAFGGTVVVANRSRSAWRAGVGPVVAELSAGGPLSPETWLHVLHGLGVRDLRVDGDDESCRLVVGTRR